VASDGGDVDVTKGAGKILMIGQSDPRRKTPLSPGSRLLDNLDVPLPAG
jgi:hypothetical protein